MATLTRCLGSQNVLRAARASGRGGQCFGVTHDGRQFTIHSPDEALFLKAKKKSYFCLEITIDMSTAEKYINPFTDFGCKKLFGTEPSLENRPAALKDRIFQKVFETAEIAKFSPGDKVKYEERLKYYRDLKNVVDTSYEEGKAEGKAEGKMEIARQMKSDGESVEKIIRYTGLSAQDFENI